MNLLAREDLKTLMEKQKGPSVSIYVPTHRAGKEVEQNPIRFKNLLREAEERLLMNGLRSPEVKELLEPGHRLLEDGSFWRQQQDGLAVFLSQGMVHHYRLPIRFEELVVVTDRFHLKPLLPLLSGDGKFFILALSQNEVRLLQGTRHNVSAVNLAGVPQSLAEALKFDLPQKQLQFHTGTPAGRGRRDALFYGTGASDPDVKDAILRYFQQVDRGLQEVLKDERAPLVFAGVDYLFPIYREANKYHHLMDEGLVGNPEELSAEELHKRAWVIVEPSFQRAQKEARARYRALAGTGLASSNLKEVVPAAYHGRIECLFVAVTAHRWGAFDPQSNTVHAREKAEPGDEDLLDFAAIHTLSNGGTVYAVARETVPGGEPVAALFRH